MKSSRPKRWTLSAQDSAPPTPPPTENGPSVRGLTRDDLDVVFQPIVDLSTRRIFAYEALTRCKWPEYTNPAVLFSHAADEVACGRLGRIIREVTFDRGAGFPLFVNVHPDELSARWLVRPDDPLYMHDHHVFVEITESAAFTHYELCKSVLREMSTRGGVFLAVDDLGAGHSNLKRVLDLEPDIVKLDRALITNLDQSRRQQILVRHMVALCNELDAKVVAEGIETSEELAAVADAGVAFGQGYLFAQPAYPLPKAKWPGGRSAPPETAAKAMFATTRVR
ncbi:MAG TPA: EAL domain-containing protein [Polyangiaceae bacterium]|jgi:EAL domain-containing protein (putative c-di-GMP-specific phosphodiesterase class I)|nr:EAL domain-containing protein [Polyangiaceae bacterium]